MRRVLIVGGLFLVLVFGFLVFRANKNTGVPVLMYHMLSDWSPRRPLAVPVKEFERQMWYLQQRGYTVMPLATMLARLSSDEPLPPKTVALTFDDGYMDNYLEDEVYQQKNAPIIEALERYIEDGTVRFHMPGHKGKQIIDNLLNDFLGNQVFAADVTNVPGMDDPVMNELYNGKWSWKRRAILVELDNGRKTAASMHGMPHGAGAIRGNNFNGHFCIHFRDSTTHGSGDINMGHQIMVWKAANRVDEQLCSLTPQGRVEVIFTAINQDEINIVKKLIDDKSNYANQLLVGLQDIESARLYSIENKEKNSFKVNAGVVYRDSYREYIKNLTISLKHKKNQPLKIERQTILPLLDKEVWLEIKQWDINQMAEDDL